MFVVVPPDPRLQGRDRRRVEESRSGRERKGERGEVEE
jgi:hypothetical protein